MLHEIPHHPLAGIFPLLEGAELQALAADIESHGLHEPIVLLDGSILDGRNRYRACDMAGVEPEFTEYTGDDAIGFVASLNLHRRHLTESQRAVAAGKLANLLHGQRADLAADRPANLPVLPAATPPVTQAEAAKLLNVSERTVRTARSVLESGEPEIVQAVEQGKISVSAAAEVVKLPAAEQAILAAEPAAVAPVVKALRTGDTGPLAELGEQIKPTLLKVVSAVIKSNPRTTSQKHPNKPGPQQSVVTPVSIEWPDWTGSVSVIADLAVDLPSLAREQPTLIPKHLAIARRALPRLEAWIGEMEAVNHG